MKTTGQTLKRRSAGGKKTKLYKYIGKELFAVYGTVPQGNVIYDPAEARDVVAEIGPAVQKDIEKGSPY